MRWRKVSGVLSDREISAKGGGENAPEFGEAWDDVRDGDSGSDGEAVEEDGTDRTEDGEVGVGGDKEDPIRNRYIT